ncbi:MAG: MaoC family dehydratase [Actinomycetota bacterium]
MEGRDRWFEDYQPGQMEETTTHLMTEEAIIAFAREFDPQPFHIDPVAAADTNWGGLIASGWHTGSVMMKLIATTLGPSSMGSGGGTELRWSAPVRPGDELRVRMHVVEVRPSKSRPDRGTVRFRNEVVNQRDEIVMTFTPDVLFKRRPS